MTTIQNETSGISATIQAALRNAGYGSYMSYATPVVEALTARETDIASSLVDYAVDAGADPDEVKAYMREVGMIVGTEPEVEESEDDENTEPEVTSKKGKQSKRELLEGLSAQVSSLNEQVNGLAQFARANGYRGR